MPCPSWPWPTSAPAGRRRRSNESPGPGRRAFTEGCRRCPKTLSFEAACLLDVGRAEDARAALAEARTILEPCFPTTGAASPLDSDWLDIIISQILYNQAEGRILDAAFPADPFVPPAP